MREVASLDRGAEAIITAAFWSVLLVGIADASISFARIENMLPAIVGADLALSLGKPAFRGVYVHVPLIAVGALIAVFRRGIDFIWLAALIVFAELLIVITRFIFSYEQAFMGDLVRFWYAALFLFASAYTLIHDGHVRVDVLYASFEKKVKAKINIWGTLLLGGPLCWVVLTRGLWNDTSAFNLALLNFEVTQQGFGMYVKYIMSGFLIVFALSMLFQFSSFLVTQLNVLEQDDSASENAPENVTG
jgi:TRAP-type mannitol/chloroaromatic compound transport system permease small subunit